MNPESLQQIAAICDRECEDAFISGKGKVYSTLQRWPMNAQNKEGLFTWTQPGNVGNDPDKIGPGNPTAVASFTPGDSASFTAKSPVGVYANAYLYMVLPVPETFPTRLVDFRTHTISDLSGWQALEFQQQLQWNGKIYNCAYQFNINAKTVRIFDYTSSKWIALPVTIPFPDLSKPLVTIAEFALDSFGTTHVALTINGARYSVGVKQLSTLTTSKVNKYTCGEQIDPNNKGLQCQVSVGNIEVRFL